MEVENIKVKCDKCGRYFPTWKGNTQTTCENCLHPIN